VRAHPDKGDGRQGSVEPSISAAIESVPQRISRRYWYRAGASQCSEPGLGSHPTGVRPRRQHARSDHGTDTGQFAQFRCDVFDRGVKSLAVVG
jgi:hypothetical protein